MELFTFLFLLFPYLTLSTNPTADDGWLNTVYSTAPYQNLEKCAQSCILNVYQVKTCYDYSCVCSGSSSGSYFYAGVDNITACAQQQCPSDPSAPGDAVQAFSEICQVATGQGNLTMLISSSPTSAPTSSSGAATVSSASAAPTFLLIDDLEYPESYNNLTGCSRYLLNGCRDASGNVSEPNCGPKDDLKPPGWTWDTYKGVADQAHCTTANCICESGPANESTEYYNTAITQLMYSGQSYCALQIIANDQASGECAHLMGVVADFCNFTGYKALSYYVELIGDPPNSTSANSGRYSISDKIALGVGLGMGLPAIIAQVISICFSYRSWKNDRRAWPGLRARLTP